MTDRRASYRSRAPATYQEDNTELDIALGEVEAPAPEREFDIVHIVSSGRFQAGHAVHMRSQDLTVDFINQSGFRNPLLFTEREHLGLTVPPPSFSVYDVMDLVGPERMVDVMDCTTQEALSMTMQEWAKYYHGRDKKSLLNVISLEFSHSKLDPLVQAPALVRAIDWVDTIWPAELRQRQRAETNDMRSMKYPKVQKYCLMSVEGCYTDWHVDFGGSSVWYHLLRGTKVFFLVPPTARNIRKFEKWSKESQSSVFFGDLCDDCHVVTLQAGSTFLIPTGWLHAVYTPVDSLVFGGNFLHGFNIDGQLEIMRLESRLHVPPRYRFPFFEELMWYAAANFLQVLRTQGLGALSPFEVQGITELLDVLRAWAASSQHAKLIPRSITAAVGTETLLTELLRMTENDDYAAYSPTTSASSSLPSSALRHDAANDIVDQDAAEYAQLPMVRRSLQKSNPDASEERLTQLAVEKWALLPQRSQDAFRETFASESPASPADRKSKYERGIYQAPKEILQRAASAREQILKNVSASSSSRLLAGITAFSKAPSRSSYPLSAPVVPQGARLLPAQHAPAAFRTAKRIIPINKLISISNGPAPAPAPVPLFIPRRVGNAESTLLGSIPGLQSARQQPPSAPRQEIPRLLAPPHARDSFARDGGLDEDLLSAIVQAQAAPLVAAVAQGWINLPFDVWVQIFLNLSQLDIRRCMQTCRTLEKYGAHPMFWQTLDLTHVRIDVYVVRRIVALEPRDLILSWTGVNTSQLKTVLSAAAPPSRVDLTGCYNATALPFAFERMRAGLDALVLNFVPKISDQTLEALAPFLAPLRVIGLAGTDITDFGVQQLLGRCAHLESLDLYGCLNVTDVAFASVSEMCPRLAILDLRTTRVMDDLFGHFQSMEHLQVMDCRDTQVTEAACVAFALDHGLLVTAGHRLTKTNDY